MTASKLRNIGPKSAAWLRQVGLQVHRRPVAFDAAQVVRGRLVGQCRGPDQHFRREATGIHTRPTQWLTTDERDLSALCRRAQGTGERGRAASNYNKLH